MNKKVNLILATYLFGGLTTALPIIGKIIVFTGIAVVLFFKYDEFSYNHDHKQSGGGAE